MSWLSDSGVLTKRDMQNMQSGGAQGLELGTAGLHHASFTGEKIIAQLVKVLQYQEGRSGC